METIKNILSSTSNEDIIKRIKEIKESNIKENEYLNVINILRSIIPVPSKKDIDIAAMIIADSYTEEETTFSIKAYGFGRLKSGEKVMYDISSCKWENVMAMEVSESTLTNLLPDEVMAAIIIELTANGFSKPKSGTAEIITEDNFIAEIEEVYKAFNINDDRTEEEKEKDRNAACVNYYTTFKNFMKYAYA